MNLTPSRTSRSCISLEYALGFKSFSSSMNSTTSRVIFGLGYADLGGCMDEFVTLWSRRTFWTKCRLVLVIAAICRWEKFSWYKSKTLSRNIGGKLLSFTYKPPLLFTPIFITGNISIISILFFVHCSVLVINFVFDNDIHHSNFVFQPLFSVRSWLVQSTLVGIHCSCLVIWLASFV